MHDLHFLLGLPLAYRDLHTHQHFQNSITQAEWGNNTCVCVQVSYIPKLISQKIKCWGICMSLLLACFII